VARKGLGSLGAIKNAGCVDPRDRDSGSVRRNYIIEEPQVLNAERQTGPAERRRLCNFAVLEGKGSSRNPLVGTTNKPQRPHPPVVSVSPTRTVNGSDRSWTDHPIRLQHRSVRCGGRYSLTHWQASSSSCSGNLYQLIDQNARRKDLIESRRLSSPIISRKNFHPGSIRYTP
jgi:hypothetical protein